MISQFDWVFLVCSIALSIGLNVFYYENRGRVNNIFHQKEDFANTVMCHKGWYIYVVSNIPRNYFKFNGKYALKCSTILLCFLGNLKNGLGWSSQLLSIKKITINVILDNFGHLGTVLSYSDCTYFSDS